MMRFIAVLLCTQIFFGAQVLGQSLRGTPGMHFGLQGAVQAYGIANQNNYGQKEMEYQVPVGYAAGVTLQIQKSERDIFLIGASLQRQGQKYKDLFGNTEFKKDVNLKYLYFPVLYRRMLGADLGYQAVSTFGKPKWFVEGGIQPGFLTSAEIDWQLNGQDVDFLTFVSDGGNPNATLIAELGEPINDDEFFQSFDLLFITGAGFYSSVSENVVAVLEVRGGIGLLDINADTWRLDNRNGIYEASRSAFLGLGITFLFQISE